MTVFTAFFAMVMLGVTHGLILLPVILSLVGPTTNVKNLSGTGEQAEEKEVPELPSTYTGRTLVSGDLEEDDSRSLTDSVVAEVCEVNGSVAGSPARSGAGF